MNRLAATWNRFWFEPSTATHLVVARVVLYQWVARQALGLRSARWAELPDVFWEPMSFHRALGLPLLDAFTLSILDAVYFTAALCSAAGLLSRASMAVTAVLALYLLGLPNDFGKINHGGNVLVMILCLMPFSRAGTVGSVDAVLRAWLRPSRPRPPARSGEYTWPIRAACVCIVVMYFAAGVSKLLASGPDWVLSDNLSLTLTRMHYSHQPPTRLGLAVAREPAVAQTLAAAAVSLELLSPLAFVHRRAFYAVGVGLFCMQAGIWLLMGVAFRMALGLFVLFWLPWGAWLDRALARAAAFWSPPRAG